MEHAEVMARYGIGSLEPAHGSAIASRFGDCRLRLAGFEPKRIKLVLNESPNDPELAAVLLERQLDGSWLPLSSDYMRFGVSSDDPVLRTVAIDEKPVATPEKFTVAAEDADELDHAYEQLERAVRRSRFWKL